MHTACTHQVSRLYTYTLRLHAHAIARRFGHAPPADGTSRRHVTATSAASAAISTWEISCSGRIAAGELHLRASGEIDDQAAAAATRRRQQPHSAPQTWAWAWAYGPHAPSRSSHRPSRHDRDEVERGAHSLRLANLSTFESSADGALHRRTSQPAVSKTRARQARLATGLAVRRCACRE